MNSLINKSFTPSTLLASTNNSVHLRSLRWHCFVTKLSARAVACVAIIASAFSLSAQTCTYSLSATSVGPIYYTGNNGITVGVTAGSGCSWTAVSSANWITINAGASGSGSGTVTYSVAANASNSSRTGTITIGGQTLTITESGAPSSCTYSLSSTAASFSSSGGSSSVAVTAGS